MLFSMPPVVELERAVSPGCIFFYHQVASKMVFWSDLHLSMWLIPKVVSECTKTLIKFLINLVRNRRPHLWIFLT